MDRLDLLAEARAEALEARAIALAAARAVRRDVGVRNLVLAARDHADPRAARALGVGIERDVVVDDQVGGDLAQPLAEPIASRPLRRRRDRLPAGFDVARDLIVGRGPEAREVLAHEVVPVSRALLGRHRRHAGEQLLVEAVARGAPREPRIEDEHAFVAEVPQRLADPDEIHQGTDGGGLGKNRDLLTRCHRGCSGRPPRRRAAKVSGL